MDGGLNEESKMKSVRGDSSLVGGWGSCGVRFVGWTVFSTLNFEPDD